MTDRLTPGQLRDLADLIWGRDLPTPPNYLAATVQIEIAEGLRNSAARREAEAPTRTDAMRQIAQEYGFGSRTPTLDALDLTKKPDAPSPRREAEGQAFDWMAERDGMLGRPQADAPPPPAPFVTDHKWLDPECHASGCQTLILKAEVEKLRDQRDKYMWQVRDTCVRAEAAEAELRIHRERAASLNNMWRHEFSREVEAAADKLFARMAWPHKEIHALAGGNDDQGK